MSYNTLSPAEAAVINHKNTEPPGSGEYDQFFQPGVFICRQCNQPLFSAQAKFEAGCGWPAFEACYDGAVREKFDRVDQRTEITCANCGGHLGHVFRGERLTATDTRHCVNSLSIRFISDKKPLPEVLYE